MAAGIGLVTSKVANKSSATVRIGDSTKKAAQSKTNAAVVKEASKERWIG
jgi:hypothetical protein